MQMFGQPKTTLSSPKIKNKKKPKYIPAAFINVTITLIYLCYLQLRSIPTFDTVKNHGLTFDQELSCYHTSVTLKCPA